MNPLPRWRHELRRAGWPSRIAPVAALAVTLVLAVASASYGTPRPQLELLLLAGLEAVLPLAVGMAAVTVIATDDCRELHLTLPASYAATLGRRLAGLAGVAGVLAVAFSAALWLAGWWSGPSVAMSPLVWAPPLLALAGLGVLVAVVGGSVTLATASIAAVWLGEQIFAGSLASSPAGRPFFLFLTSRYGVADHWVANRMTLIACGVVLTVAAAALLRRPERLLNEEEQ